MEFAGRLASFSPANLLQWAGSERRTGILVVRRSRREKRVSLRDGDVVGCRSNLIQETFGRYLVDHGLLRPDALVRVLAHSRAASLPTGEAITALGILPEEIVREQLRIWIAESVEDLCEWTRGVFVFHQREPSEFAYEVALGVQELVLEGARRSDRIRQLRAVLPDDGVVLRRGPAWPGRSRSPFEARLAQGVDGLVNLGQMRGLVGGVDFPFLEAVHGLIEDAVLAVAGREDVDTMDSREIDLADVLGSGEAEAPAAPERPRHAPLPMDVVDRLVPVWLVPPGAAELARQSPRLREFLEGMDGRNRLGLLLAREPEVAADQADLLFLQLERGHLALFPEPLEEIHDAERALRSLRASGLGLSHVARRRRSPGG
ncbi:MAG: DUF4388 domain-containing protein [Thermoanaerobaculia bacterium]|nr:MAG: DUF4388 domain-containing protein [Thermoanaerobaculia bacterium]